MKLLELKKEIEWRIEKQKLYRAMRKESSWTRRAEGQSSAHYNRIKLREMHIAYCLSLGRTIEEIELKNKTINGVKNTPDMSRVNQILEVYTKAELKRRESGENLEKNVCAG